MKERTCELCGDTIAKGDQYALKTITIGKQTCWAIDSRPQEEIPESAWEPYRIKVPICDSCANPSECGGPTAEDLGHAPGEYIIIDRTPPGYGPTN
tara:strand:- start:418 stop:705 length:288 start_codon:yes stop_codon:yes gene_type:complete